MLLRISLSRVDNGMFGCSFDNFISVKNYFLKNGVILSSEQDYVRFLFFVLSKNNDLLDDIIDEWKDSQSDSSFFSIFGVKNESL